ncbi:MAG: CapA family protein [Chlorobiaceae bacterium]
MKSPLIKITLISVIFISLVPPMNKLHSTGVNTGSAPITLADSTRQNHESSEDSLITIVAVGDIMMGTNYPSEECLPPRNTALLQPIGEILKNADISFANLEGPILDAGGKAKRCVDQSKCFAFRQPEYFLPELKAAGLNLFSVANNHMSDFGRPGRDNTCKVLRENGFHFAGLEQCPSDIIAVKGVRVGFTAFAPNAPCLSVNNYKQVTETIAALKQQCDIVIVSFHGGGEGSRYAHVPRRHEQFYDEDRGDVYAFARVAIDAGADVVLGHGPHVTRAIDCYKGRFIAYSMGNFCTYGQFNLKGISGIAPVFKLHIRKDGSFVYGNAISIKQINEGGPLVDSANQAFRQIQTLTAADIPELKVNYGRNGYFSFQ